MLLSDEECGSKLPWKKKNIVETGKDFWNIAGGCRLKARREECRRNDHIDIVKTL